MESGFQGEISHGLQVLGLHESDANRNITSYNFK